MRLVTWNVNGLRAVMRKGFVGWLAEANADVVCLQETRARPEQVEDFWTPLGYRADWNPAERPGYSGVLTLSRQAPLAVRTGVGEQEFDSEGRVLVSEFPKFLLYNVYFPSGQRGLDRVEFKLRFYDRLLSIIDRLQEAGRQLVVCGDYNTAHREIDLARPRENAKTSGFLPQERAWVDRYIEHGLVDVFRAFHPNEPGHYTWWSTPTGARNRDVGWRIDYFMLTSGLVPAVQAVTILPEVMGSDHCPVVLDLDLQ